MHALAPALLLGVATVLLPSRTAVPSALGDAITYAATALYWCWPLWLWPLVSHRSRQSLSYLAVLLLACIAWAALVPTMFIVTLMMLSSGQAMHV